MAKKKFNISSTVETVSKVNSISSIPIGNKIQNSVRDNIVILEDLEYFIRKLSPSEYALLEKDIQDNGCKEPIKLWRRSSDFVIVDGHHRYKICTDHGIDFKTEALEFISVEDVKVYMAKLQLGRRNLTAQEVAYLRGMQYALNKTSVGKNTSEGGSTRNRLASEYGVSPATISRDYLTYKAVEKLPFNYRSQFLEGESFLQKQDLELLAKTDIDVNAFLSFRESGKTLKEFLELNQDSSDDVVEEKIKVEKKNYISSFSTRFMKDFNKADDNQKKIYREQLLELLAMLDK